MLTLDVDIQNMSYPQIAYLIRASWHNKKGESTINYAANPYLDAMGSLTNEGFGQDSAKSIILYFLSNASGYRGEVAKIVKAELKKRAA